MERDDIFQAATHEAHDIRYASAISGALIGGTTGMLGGVVGMGAAGLVGAVLGALGGLALERHLRRVDEGEPKVPEIEPPLVEGPEGELHLRQHPRGHVHYAYPQSFAVGSMLFRPTF